jgi:hypothetical protein
MGQNFKQFESGSTPRSPSSMLGSRKSDVWLQDANIEMVGGGGGGGGEGEGK